MTLFELNSFVTQGGACFSPFGHPTQVVKNWLQVKCICVKFTPCLRRREPASRLANQFGHPSHVRTQVLVLQTWVDLRVESHRRARAQDNGGTARIFFTHRATDSQSRLYFSLWFKISVFPPQETFVELCIELFDILLTPLPFPSLLPAFPHFTR